MERDESCDYNTDYLEFVMRREWWERRALRLAPGRLRREAATGPSDADIRRMVNVLKAARSRCRNPRVYNFENYGGRGITFSDELNGLGGAERLLREIGCRPSADHSIDRVDNQRGYEFGNLRWATRKQQRANRRDS